jgi:hypothetical protein
MNIAILGINGKGLDAEETKQAMEKIVELTKMYRFPTLMTMHSPNGGVNTLVELYASTESNNTALKEYDYGDNLTDWKDSSQMLAEDCDVFFCITTKIKKNQCHHCLDYTHERTGACYPMKLAKKMGKQTKLIIL